MKKKNIILIAIAIAVIVICILAVVIGFGLSDKKDDDDDEKKPVQVSQELSDESEEEKEKYPDVEPDGSASEEETEEKTETEVETETETESETEGESETSTEVETEAITEKETEEQTVSKEPMNRLSYEYMIIDGKSVYIEYNEKIMELFENINVERKKKGISALTFDKNVSYIASARASQIAYECDFESDGLQYYELMKQYGINFSKAVENIAAGHAEAKSVVSGNDSSWKTSQTHYENMLSEDYSKVGVGVDYSEELGYIWVAIFSN